jgi:hypothetical protein
MPMRLRTPTGSMFLACRSTSWYRMRPSVLKFGITSFIRFRQRMKVLLPQPDGPMIAVTIRW